MSVTITVTALTLDEAIDEIKSYAGAATTVSATAPAAQSRTRRRSTAGERDEPTANVTDVSTEKKIGSTDELKTRLIELSEITGDPGAPLTILGRVKAKKISEVPVELIGDLIETVNAEIEKARADA